MALMSGAGSVITENVPAEGLAIARGRQVNKPGWAARKRREMALGDAERQQSPEGKTLEHRDSVLKNSILPPPFRPVRGWLTSARPSVVKSDFPF